MEMEPSRASASVIGWREWAGGDQRLLSKGKMGGKMLQGRREQVVEVEKDVGNNIIQLWL